MRSVARLVPLLPPHLRQGHRWNDHRTVINGVFFRTRAGCPWRDLPREYGKWKTVYNRHRRLARDGACETILNRPRAGGDHEQVAAQTIAADPTQVRLHHHSDR